LPKSARGAIRFGAAAGFFVVLAFDFVVRVGLAAGFVDFCFTRAS
jgi:hypothetical protein